MKTETSNNTKSRQILEKNSSFLKNTAHLPQSQTSYGYRSCINFSFSFDLRSCSFGRAGCDSENGEAEIDGGGGNGGAGNEGGDIGKACDADHLCQAPTRCDSDGICKLFDLGLGANCDSNRLCSGSFECIGDRCQKPGIGAACEDSDSCAGNLQCHFGKCKSFVSRSDSCNANHVCSGFNECSGVHGTCKLPVGSLYGEICNDSSECPNGASCQKDIHGNGPYCLRDVGEQASSAAECVHGETTRDTADGLRCALPAGGDCSHSEELCALGMSCQGGLCIRDPGYDGGICSNSSECPNGASCQKDLYGDGPHCFLNGGQKTDEPNSSSKTRAPEWRAPNPHSALG